VPPEGGATFTIHYTETPTEYLDSDQYQLFVLPGDAFAKQDHAWAGEFLAFERTHFDDTDGTANLIADFRVKSETTVIVAYGPRTAPDAGRPAGDVPTFRLEVTSDGGAFEWVESEMGELLTTNWTNRPDVKRGKPFREGDHLSGGDVYLEVRPMILYDGRMVRTLDEYLLAGSLVALDHKMALQGTEGVDDYEVGEDRRDARTRADRRITMTRALAEKFRRVPIRWR
jgi:hypothetical protein